MDRDSAFLRPAWEAYERVLRLSPDSADAVAKKSMLKVLGLFLHYYVSFDTIKYQVFFRHDIRSLWLAQGIGSLLTLLGLF